MYIRLVTNLTIGGMKYLHVSGLGTYNLEPYNLEAYNWDAGYPLHTLYM